MNSNKDLYVKIISIASLVVLGYIFFISVYNQIIVQSGGVFYVIIFGGILILAFVLLSLVTKLIEITGEIRDNTMWNCVEILLLCLLSYLFLIFRMAYKSTVPGEETVLYRAAALMKEGALAEKGMDMIEHLCIYPSQYLYSFVLSIFFRIGGVQSSVLVTLNAVTLILSAFLIDRVVRKIAGRACGIIAAMCTIFIPSQSFAVYSYSSEVFFCTLLLLSIDLWLIVMEVDDSDRKKQLILSGLFGLSLALLCFVEPLMLLIVPVFIVGFVLRYKNDDKDPSMMAAVAAAAFVLIFLLMTIIKAAALGTGFGDVVSGGLSRYKLSTNIETSEKYTAGDIFGKFHENLDNQNTNVRDNYHFLVNDEGESYTQTHNAWFSLGTQMSYMFVLVMSIACAFYMFRNKRGNAVPVFITLICGFIILFFRSTDEPSTFFMFELLIITACCGLNYMYMNHHPELFGQVRAEGMPDAGRPEVDSALGGALEWGAIARAKKLIFVKNEDENKDNAAMGQNPDAEGQETAGADGTEAISQQIPVSYLNEPAPAPSQFSAPANNGMEILGGNVSPEGYFSFFDLSPTPAPVDMAPAPAPAPVQVDEYTEPVEEYSEPAEEYSEPLEEYSEPVEDYTEGYSEPVEDYNEEYSEQAEDYTEDYSEGYSEPVEEYTEGYSGPIEDYTEDAQEYSEGYSDEYSGYDSGYDEPSFDELAEEYGEPDVSEPAEEYVREPVRQNPSYGSSTKASFTSAAHALGFSLSDEFFSDAGTAEEPVYEEPVYEEEPYDEQEYEDSAYDEQEYEEPAYEVSEYGENGYDEPGYDDPQGYEPSYDAGIDEFSFGEGMPDISAFDEPEYAGPAYEEPVNEEP
ncbi:MAG TPA: hypothetical protein DIS78_01805, partial [Lachnospiraceae bacterium]|nr:hypothetical protein [Lachnospiraceae bacterium]